MSETRDAFGPLLRQMQAEMRSIRAEQAAVRTLIDARARETETLIETLFGRLEQRLDQTERSVEERLARIEGLLATGRSIEADLAEELDGGSDAHG
jgi:ferritin-like metal-binding protein YciE